MMRLIYYGNTLPASFLVDPSAEFQAGMLAELTVMGNQVLATVSNGTAPIGIIDDMKTRAFTNVSWNETIIVPATGSLVNGQYVSTMAIMAELRRPNILRHSFTSTVSVVLNPVNGTITFPAGTPLNIDLTGAGTSNGIKAIVSYTYNVANIPGDDSTQGSGRVTVWFNRGFFQTDQYETNQAYPVRANLYCSEYGLWTTRRPSSIHPAIGMVTAPPNTVAPYLELLMF
jgi:hypothetical protein